MTTMGTAAASPQQQPVNSGSVGVGTTKAGATMLLVCRAVSLNTVDASANSEIAYAVQNELQACKYFDPKTTTLAGNISSDDPNGTFTFGVNVTLSPPPQF